MKLTNHKQVDSWLIDNTVFYYSIIILMWDHLDWAGYGLLCVLGVWLSSEGLERSAGSLESKPSPKQRDICPGLEGFHASGRPHDLDHPGLPAGWGSQRVNPTQMDPSPALEHTHEGTHTCARIRMEADVKCGCAGREKIKNTVHSELTLRNPLTW